MGRLAAQAMAGLKSTLSTAATPCLNHGNAEDLKSCETSSGVSQLNGAHRAVTERTPPLLLFIEACQMGQRRRAC